VIVTKIDFNKSAIITKTRWYQ